MEEDKTKMSKAELQQWIRAKVKKSRLLDREVLEKRDELQSLLETRQKMAANLLKAEEYVASVEAILKKQYSLMGWEYRDTDSDEDESSCGGSAVTGPTHLSPKQQGSKNRQRSRKPFQMMEPVVVLTRLPDRQMRDLLPPATPMSNSDDDSLSDADSDEQWEPEKESSDSQAPSYNSGSKKRRKIVSQKEHVTRNERDQADTKTEADSNAAKTLEPQAKEQKNTEHEQEEKNPTKESSPPVNTKVTGVTAPRKSSGDATKAPPSVPQAELSVNMKVLARKQPMIWQRGKIAEILTKEDGKVKYKVNFVEKGKSLVSAHHITLEQVPSIEQLFVGARVVVKSKVDQNYFPGVLAELPSRKNKMRFLIFMDEHTPIYVPLHGFHLVCRPLSDPLDDIQDDAHKKFMVDYLKSWPIPLLTHYPPGEIIEAEHKGVQKKCEVMTVDSSLVQVVFQEDQHKQWFYRGSMRLKHMINLRKQMELEKVTRRKQSTSSDHK